MCNVRIQCSLDRNRGPKITDKFQMLIYGPLRRKGGVLRTIEGKNQQEPACSEINVSGIGSTHRSFMPSSFNRDSSKVYQASVVFERHHWLVNTRITVPVVESFK